MTNKEARKNLRKIAVNSHQIFFWAWFHGFFQDRIGKVIAIVETEDGSISSINMEIYQIKFVDE